MPEGDSIRNAAAVLGPVLLGQRIERAASRWPSACFGLRGREIVELEPIGKHLWLILDDGNAIRVHLAMHGRWRIFPAGEPYRGSLGGVSLLLELPSATVVCTGAPTVERVPARHRRAHPVMARLGPDVLGEAFDPQQAIPRIAQSPATTLAEVLLDQRVACGIGNIYACEILFVERLYPFDPPSALDPPGWRAVYLTARELMRRNLGPDPRVTGPDPSRRTWVYGRTGRSCLRCGTRIVRRMSRGDLPRPTWWCPDCQRPRSEGV